MDGAHVWQLPLYHPESPWRHQWKKIVPLLGPALMEAKKRGGHNVKFDTRWLRHFGCHVVPTFCTIVMAALLDENRPKGLKPLAQQILGADPWGIDTKDLLTTPLDEVLVYNGLDTWHDMRLYFIFRKQMMERKRIARLFVHLMMPAVQELVDVERRGVYVDTERLMLNRADVEGKLQAVEELLMKHVPEDKPYPVNFNRSNFLVWWLYEHLKLPVLARGKTKDDGRAGDPSCAEAVMMMLAEDHEVPGLMLERTKWYKMISSFFGPYAEQLDVEHRIHTTFKPWGTVTGRLSSGKEDEEKITAKAQTRGVNLQQVPRDKLVRGVFGAPPGSSFVEADYSQIELRLAAFLANEPTMLHLYATGQDIHMAMAMRMTGKPASQITAEERKRAKAVNFGFLYGMGWHKFIQTAWSNYGLHVNEVEARGARKAFFDEFNRLPAWHSRQRQFATKYGYVTTPMGRVRHLPDIYSPDEGVRAEAERQAINSPVQGFASDMALLSLSLVSRQFKRVGLAGHPVGTVHDAVNFEIPNDELTRALPIIKRTMENLPLQRLFGIQLSVPIVADLKIGRHWGGATEVPAPLIHDRTQLRGWLKEHAA
jgi:DNA polymerase I-like protein with 3'-5' exonuclease and polymerase domains